MVVNATKVIVWVVCLSHIALDVNMQCAIVANHTILGAASAKGYIVTMGWNARLK